MTFFEKGSRYSTVSVATSLHIANSPPPTSAILGSSDPDLFGPNIGNIVHANGDTFVFAGTWRFVSPSRVHHVNSLSPPSAIIGSTNASLFPPHIATQGTIVFNEADNNSYVFGVDWQQLNITSTNLSSSLLPLSAIIGDTDPDLFPPIHAVDGTTVFVGDNMLIYQGSWRLANPPSVYVVSSAPPVVIGSTNSNLFAPISAVNGTVVHHNDTTYVYDGTWKLLSRREVHTSYALLTPGSVIGNTNANLFAPISAVDGTVVWNAGPTYIYSAGVWQYLNRSITNNLDQTVNVGEYRLAEFNETINSNYIPTKTALGLSYTPISVLAYNQTAYLTPNTIGRINVIQSARGLQLTITHINGSPIALNTRVMFGTRYLVAYADGTITFNPGEFYDGLVPGEEAIFQATYTLTDNTPNSSTANLTFIVQRTVAAARAFDSSYNYAYKLGSLDTGLYMLSKNITGTDIVASLIGTSSPIAADENSALVYNLANTRLYYIKRLSATSRELHFLSFASDSSAVASIPFVTNLDVGNVPVTTATGYIRAAAINQNDAVGFFLNEEAAGVNFAAIVTFPGYRANTIPGITEIGTVVPVRDNAANGVTTIRYRHRGSMAWSAGRNRYYSVAMTGSPTTGSGANIVGTTVGIAGQFRLVEATLNYTTYNPTAAAPYVGYTAAVYALTIPGVILPTGAFRGQQAEAMFVDSANILYVFAVNNSTTTGSFVFTVNLALLPNIAATNASITVINSASAITALGDATANIMAISALSAPDLSLSAAGLPITATNTKNSYTVAGPIAATSGSPRIIKPLTVVSATPIRRMYFEFLRYSSSTLAPTSIPVGITARPPIDLGSTRLQIYDGPASITAFNTLLSNMQFTSAVQGEHEVSVWVEAINGVSSIRRVAYILI